MSYDMLSNIKSMSTGVTGNDSRGAMSIKLGPKSYRGGFLFEGRVRAYTMMVIAAPYNVLWSFVVMISIIYAYVIHFLVTHYYTDPELIFYLDTTVIITEFLFFADVIILYLHAFWPLVRMNIRVLRVSKHSLLFDTFTLIPFFGIALVSRNETLVTYTRWLTIIRIYRWLPFYRKYYECLSSSRSLHFLLETMVCTQLILHAGACIWFGLNRPGPKEMNMTGIGYPPHVGGVRVSFESYGPCWYYCACRLSNVVFGDTFPVTRKQKLFTVIMMFIGYGLMKNRIIGILAWDLVLKNCRRMVFIDQYYHMLQYLKFHAAPESLVKQASSYKYQLWVMKDGVTYSDHIKNLPLALQMELIFDINVGHLHDSLLFRNCGEPFMRSVSLLIRHQMFLAGQTIWNQGVVKCGMIFIKRGVIEVLSDEDDESPMIAFKEGTVLGEASLFYSLPAKVTLKAATYVELQLLRRTDFIRGMSENIVMYDKIRKALDERVEKQMKRKAAITAYDEGDSRLLRTRYRPLKVLKNHLAGVEEEDAMFVDDSHMYYKDENNIRLPKFTTEYLELYKLSPNITTVETPSIFLKSRFPWILEPGTNFLLLFHLIHFICVLYVCFACPNLAVMNLFCEEWEFTILTLAKSVLLFNIGLQITTAIREKNRIRTTMAEIAEVKLANLGFYMDLISVFPFHIFTDTIDPSKETVLSQIALLAPTLQCWHIFEYMKQWDHSFHVRNKLMCLLKYTIIVVLFCYWSGCILFLFSCPRFQCREGTWMSQLIQIETKILVPSNAQHQNPPVTALFFGTSVFTASGTNHVMPGIKDIFVVPLLFFAGITVYSFYIARLCYIYMLSMKRKLKYKEGITELSYFLSVNNISSKIRARVNKFFCTQWYYNNGVTTEELFGNMSTNIQQEILSLEMVETLLQCSLFKVLIALYFYAHGCYQNPVGAACNVSQKTCSKYISQVTEALTHPSILEKYIKFPESPAARQEVSQSFFNKFGIPGVIGCVDESHFRIVCPPKAEEHLYYCRKHYHSINVQMGCSHDFLQTVAARSVSMVLPYDEVVQHAADIGRDMYILKKGCCKLLNHEGKVINTIGPGSEIGVLEMLYDLPKVHTVITSTNCILLHVEYSAFIQCLSSFPHVAYPVKRLLKNMEILELTKKYQTPKPLTGKLETKINRIAMELKESFVMMSGNWDEYMKPYESLGILRFLRFFILPFSITPHGFFLKFWCFLRVTFAVYYILIIPYNVATRTSTLENSNLILCDLFLYLDLMVKAYIGYYNDNSLLITHPYYTINYYIRNSFWVDVLTVFPFEYLINIMYEHGNLDLYRVNRLLQVTRIIGAISYLEDDIMYVSSGVSLLKFLPIALTIINLGTALVFMKSCTVVKNPDKYFYECSCTRMLLTDKNKQPSMALKEYARCFIWVFETFMGCGCVSISLNNEAPLLLTALEITGFLYFAFMYGYTASTRSATTSILLEHTEKKKDLADFLYQQNVDPGLTEKTIKYFDYIWKRTNGSNPQKICRRLHSSLMEDTLVFMYEKTLREVPLFSNMERSFIRVITQHLNEMYFLKGETVIQCYDIQPNIYIIYRGKVDIYNDYNEMISCMGPGGMFGNFTGQSLACSEVSIIASRSLDLLVIPTTTFFNLIKYYPKILEPLNKAFHVSKYYILPISTDIPRTSSEYSMQDDFYSSDEEYQGRVSEKQSTHSDSPSVVGKISVSSLTHSTYSQTTSSKYGDIASKRFNMLKPGTVSYLAFGYLTCVMVTLNHLLVLYKVTTLNNCYLLYWLIGLLDIFFFFKIYLDMHMWYSHRNGDIVHDGKKCRAKYFSSKARVWFDVIANLSFESAVVFLPQYQTYLNYICLNKVLRLKYMHDFYKKTSAQLTNNLTALQAVITIFILVIGIHTFTCIWLLTLSIAVPHSQLKKLKPPQTKEVTIPNRWDYITALYMMIAELTGTGTDEYAFDDTKTMRNGLFVIWIMDMVLICGKVLASISVAHSLLLKQAIHFAMTSYELMCTELYDVLKNEGLSEYQLKRYWRYIEQLWQFERGRQLPALLEQTPYVRRCDLMSAMFGHHLRNSYLFGDTGEVFLRQMTVFLEYTHYFPGNYIVNSGDSDSRMYWVSTGTVSVVSVRPDLTEITHEVLNPGDVFGLMQGLHKGMPHCFSYRATTKASILSLYLDSWINILPHFPEAQESINSKAERLFTYI